MVAAHVQAESELQKALITGSTSRAHPAPILSGGDDSAAGTISVQAEADPVEPLSPQEVARYNSGLLPQNGVSHPLLALLCQIQKRQGLAGQPLKECSAGQPCD